MDYIEKYCAGAGETDPSEIAVRIMKNPKIKMHGPEHHFLVPAALLASYCNATGKRDALPAMLAEARKRAKNVLGGFCGFYGACGAGVGTGIFVSVMTGSTPLSGNEWGLCNLMTSESLASIAEGGGPRCCKRDSFRALESAAAFLKERFGVIIPLGAIKCVFSAMNKECKKDGCKYYG
jgi:hypothetical protein